MEKKYHDVGCLRNFNTQDISTQYVMLKKHQYTIRCDNFRNLQTEHTQVRAKNSH